MKLPLYDEKKTARQIWISQLKIYRLPNLRYELRQVRRHFIDFCPDNECKKVNHILWFDVGNHDDCIPF